VVQKDEASCVVFGMPREAIAHGAAHEVLPARRAEGAESLTLEGSRVGLQGDFAARRQRQKQAQIGQQALDACR
jgi:hypothetical protein